MRLLAVVRGVDVVAARDLDGVDDVEDLLDLVGRGRAREEQRHAAELLEGLAQAPVDLLDVRVSQVDRVADQRPPCHGANPSRGIAPIRPRRGC